jgi:2-methylisocitrate lyase-like PEP mutase family enzyme
MDQQQKGEFFAALHRRERAFIIPNPWDVGTARLLASAGFEALATTSAGYAFSTGVPDGAVGRAEMIAHIRQIVSATDLPVSADLENGFGDAPEAAAETIRRGIAAGRGGGSIEDSSGRPDAPIYEREHSAERVRAAAEAASASGLPFTLTGRAENYLHGRRDLADTIARLQAYQEAGADVLYAPGLTTEEEIAQVVREVDRPVNVLAFGNLPLETLSQLGVKRVSVGGSLYRTAMAALMGAAEEMQTQGTFDALGQALSHQGLTELFGS